MPEESLPPSIEYSSRRQDRASRTTFGQQRAVSP